MEEKNHKISYFSANITPVISVALVLFLMGVVGVLCIAAANLTDYVKENIGFDVVVKSDASQHDVDALKKMWTTAPYVSSVKYISKEDALLQWEKETGENLIEVLGVNPLNSEFEVRVKAQYVSVDSLNKIEYALAQIPSIDVVKMHKDVVEQINSNVRNVVVVLGSVLVILLIISFVLINNTVRLAVYSRRFIIHTMKLVGATPGFIRRPFVLTNALNGFIASLLAILLLSATLYYVKELNHEYANLIGTAPMMAVCGGMVVAGVAMCCMAAWLATNRFISLDYDELFTK